MNRYAQDWKHFQQRTGWIFGPGETALCVVALTIIVLFGADAIRAYLSMMAMIGHWMGSGQ